MELGRNSRSPVVPYSLPPSLLPISRIVRSHSVVFPIKTLVGVDRAPPRTARMTIDGPDSGPLVINHLPIAMSPQCHDDAGRRTSMRE